MGRRRYKYFHDEDVDSGCVFDDEAWDEFFHAVQDDVDEFKISIQDAKMIWASGMRLKYGEDCHG